MRLKSKIEKISSNYWLANIDELIELLNDYSPTKKEFSPKISVFIKTNQLVEENFLSTKFS
jgi:hypothetical protein